MSNWRRKPYIEDMSSLVRMAAKPGSYVPRRTQEPGLNTVFGYRTMADLRAASANACPGVHLAPMQDDRAFWAAWQEVSQYPFANEYRFGSRREAVEDAAAICRMMREEWRDDQ